MLGVYLLSRVVSRACTKPVKYTVSVALSYFAAPGTRSVVFV